MAIFYRQIYRQIYFAHGYISDIYPWIHLIYIWIYSGHTWIYLEDKCQLESKFSKKKGYILGEAQ